MRVLYQNLLLLQIKNNMAVCLLYYGKQKEAVTLLEAVITSNPTAGLHENLLLNLCTLYELESSSSLENKYKMLRMVAKYKGDAVSLHCLKLQAKDWALVFSAVIYINKYAFFEKYNKFITFVQSYW